MTAKLRASRGPIENLTPGQWQVSCASVCQIMLELCLSIHGFGGNKQCNGDLRFIGDGPQVHKIVTIPIIKGKHHGWRSHIPGTQQFDGVAEAHNAIVPLQEPELAPKRFCGNTHAMRTVRYQMMRQNKHRISTTASSIPGARDKQW